MRNIPTSLSILLLTLTLFSCQKELSHENSLPGNNNNNNNNNASLQGNWKFIDINAAVEASTSFSLSGIPGKIVATYTAISQQNTGFLAITANTMKTTDLGYSIAADIKILTYAAGVQIDEETQHMDFTMPPGSASSNYQQIGSDSLYFPNGTIFDIPDANGQQPAGASDPAGAKFAITSDTLVIKSGINKTITTNQNGIDYIVNQKVNAVARFKKQ